MIDRVTEQVEELEEGGPSRATLARRVLAFEEAVSRRIATSVERVACGYVRRSPDLARVSALNGLTIDRPAAVVEVAGLVERYLGGVARQRIATSRPEVAWALWPALAEKGWEQESLVHMVWDPAVTPRVSPVGFEVVSAAEYARFHRPFIAEFPWGPGAEEVAQLLQRDLRMEARVGARFVMSRDGRAGCEVYRRGATAQIESVGVLAEARGQGLGSGLMAAALRECEGAETVFLVADGDDWPRRWYRKLGFTEVAAAWDWGRTVVEGSTPAEA